MQDNCCVAFSTPLTLSIMRLRSLFFNTVITFTEYFIYWEYHWDESIALFARNFYVHTWHYLVCSILGTSDVVTAPIWGLWLELTSLFNKLHNCRHISIMYPYSYIVPLLLLLLDPAGWVLHLHNITCELKYAHQPCITGRFTIYSHCTHKYKWKPIVMRGL
jgi:hypothetical protein